MNYKILTSMGACVAMLLAGCGSERQRSQSTYNEPAGAEIQGDTNAVDTGADETNKEPMVIPRNTYQRPYPGYPVTPQGQHY